MRPRVILTHWVHPEVLELLGGACDVVPQLERDVLPAEEVRRRGRDSQAIIMCMADSLDESFLDACPQLIIVAAALKGYDNFDVEACTRHGVWFTNVPDLLSIPTAELAVALLLGLGRKVLPGDRSVRGGNYAGWRPTLYGTGLQGRTVGLVGMGALGRAVARRLIPFEVQLLYTYPTPLPSDEPLCGQVRRVEFGDLLSRSDYIVLLAPLTAGTRQMLDRRGLALCKPGTHLINVGRGSVVDEEAVAEALTSGRLGGYAADVFAMEDWMLPGRPFRIPPALLEHADRTLFTPHLGSAVDDVRREISLAAARNVLQALRGDVPENAVNRSICNSRARRDAW
jgi:phosphonate dehydrogenase